MAQEATDLVELQVTDGVAFVEQGSLLTRLHYFDGKFLRADAFATEQDYHRYRVLLSNLAGGWGVVHGLSVALDDDRLVVGGGMAVTAAGNFVLATLPMRADLSALLAAAQAAQAGSSADFATCTVAAHTVKATAAQKVYEITAGPIAGLCGNESVYGKLCQTACVGESQRPFWREGVVLRLRPVALELPLPTSVPLSELHLRNRVASAYFGTEPWLTPPQLSAAGLAGSVWCGTASLYARDEVVIGLLVMDAGSGLVDAWGGRRERVDMQARAYWQGVMAMRPWNVFTAQILQFQCQLSGVLDSAGTALLPPDDCDAMRATLLRTRRELDRLTKEWADSAARVAERVGAGKGTQAELLGKDVQTSFDQIGQLKSALAVFEKGKGALPSKRMLIAAGFLDLPPAGYLPVVPDKLALHDQLRRMFGEGVRLHLHAVREDEIGHLVEQAQHLDRISLTRGIDDPQDLEDVEVFVPAGIEIEAKSLFTGEWWAFEFGLGELSTSEGFADLLGKVGKPPVPVPAPGTDVAVVTEVTTVAPKSTKTRSKAATRAGAATASSAVDKAPPALAPTATILPQALQKLQGTDIDKRVAEDNEDPPGLARTYITDGGSYALAMLWAKPAKSDANAEQGQDLPPHSALWIAGEVAGDPFEVDLNTEIDASLELGYGSKSLGLQITSELKLMVKSHDLAASGESVLSVQIAASTTLEIVLGSTVAFSVVIPGSEDFALARRGDGRTGRLIVDADPFDLSNGAVQIRWDVDPREAVLEIILETLLKAGDIALDKLKSAGADQTFLKAMGGLLPDLEAAGKAAADTRASAGALSAGLKVSARLRLALARGLPGMPAVDSPIGVASLAALKFLALKLAESSFEVRSRRKLFPELDKSVPPRTVRAVLDWVMFRRARTPLCAPPCGRIADAALDAVQVWHLQVNGMGQLKAVETALAKRDTAALSKMDFRRVGVLHYRDAGTTPEEAAVRVRAMWRAAKPLSRVVLGRAWELEPATGQGWQNHARLRAMLKLIDVLTRPPATGDGSVTVLAPPPLPLANESLDGGMLVVTADDETVSTLHRVALTLKDDYSVVVEAFAKSPADGWTGLRRLRDGGALVELNVSFVDGVLGATDKKAIGDALKDLSAVSLAKPRRALRIDRSGATPPGAAAQHGHVLGALGGLAAGGDDGHRAASVADLGDGATVMSLVFCH